jgi:Flp pilus assembly protein TadD/lysophospholipase L1-like esterase
LPKTTFSQKALLVLFGIVLTLAALELLLRFGGFLFHARQDSLNKATFSQEEVRVLCIGESTTALGDDNSYPSQLEEILNLSSGKTKFKVINKGMVSKTSYDILAQLDQNLKAYRPAIVVGMIGINDNKDTPGFLERKGIRSFLSGLRVYHLYVLLTQHIGRSMQEKALKKSGVTMPLSTERADPGVAGPETGSLDEKNYPKMKRTLEDAEKTLKEIAPLLDRTEGAGKDAVIEQMQSLQAFRVRAYKLIGTYHSLRRNYPLAEQFLTTALRLSKDSSIMLELGRLFRLQGRKEEALRMLTAAVVLDPQEPLMLMELGRAYADNGNNEEAGASFLRVLSLKPENVWIYVEIGNWFKEKGFLQHAKVVLDEAYKRNANDHTTLQALGETLNALGEKEKGAALFKQAEDEKSRLNYYGPETQRNYSEIVARVKAAGARMVIMQYPLRSVDPLKLIFRGQNDILFVENRSNFLAVLKEGAFTRYFADNFAGDFGHCTAIGNRLIAQNLADRMSQEFFSSH